LGSATTFWRFASLLAFLIAEVCRFLLVSTTKVIKKTYNSFYILLAIINFVLFKKFTFIVFFIAMTNFFAILACWLRPLP
jgi:hypothetical protein